MKKTVLLILTAVYVSICFSQITVNIGEKTHVINGNRICSYSLDSGDIEIYLQIKNDTLEYNYLMNKNKVCTGRLRVLAPIQHLDLQLAGTLEVTLNSEGKKGGMLQISTTHFERIIVHEQYDGKNEVIIDTMQSMNFICYSLIEATYWRWKISTLLKTPLPDQNILVKNTRYVVPAIPTFYSSETDYKGNYTTNHHYYAIKDDSVFVYNLNGLEPYSGRSSGISIEKTSLSQISKKNMEVRRPASTEYSIGPEKDSYVVAIGTPGKFIITDTFHTGNYRSEIQKAFMLIICSNQEMATAVYNEILKAKQ